MFHLLLLLILPGGVHAAEKCVCLPEEGFVCEHGFSEHMYNDCEKVGVVSLNFA
jgi:hypothetical protein